MVALIAIGAWLLSRRSTGSQAVSGTIETDETQVASRYGGRVERIFADEGATLAPGAPIVELEAAELRARRDQVAATLKELENGPRAEDIAAALAERDALAAELDFARAEARRAEELFAQKTISATEHDQATSRAEALAKSLAAAEQRHLVLKAGTRPEQMEQARARVAEINAQLNEMRISAPTNTVLEVLHVKVGDVVGPNRPVATLIWPDRLWVRVYVPELWLGRIQVGQNVRVQVDSHPDREFAGEVEQISRQAEFTPRNVQTVSERIKQVFAVKVRLPADAHELRPGMAADVFFPDVSPIPP